MNSLLAANRFAKSLCRCGRFRAATRSFGRDKQGFYVEDLQSVNGTFVNGLQLQGRGRLSHLDRVRIGQNVFQFFEATADEQTITIDAAALRSASRGDEGPPANDEQSSQHIVSSLDASSGGGERLELNPQAKLRGAGNFAECRQFARYGRRAAANSRQSVPHLSAGRSRIHSASTAGRAQLEAIAIKHRNSDSDTISPLGGPIVSRVMTEGTAFLSSPQADEDSVLSALPTSVMCAPLMGPSKTPLGVIHLDTSNAGKPFDQNDLDVLVAVATMAGQAVEYARMHADILELDRQKHDLATAQDVQLHFLPQKPPERPGYKFFDYYRAAATVAGDYYDYIRLPDGRLAIALGDVAGKGVPAALLMARLCSEVRYSLLTTSSAAAAVNLLNQQLTTHLRSGRFITFILIVLDTQRHELQIVNAGHSPPLLRNFRTKEVRAIASEEAEIPLGINADVDYPQVTLQLDAGSLLLIYTDGVNEALNADDEPYGNDRVRSVLKAAPEDALHVGRAACRRRPPVCGWATAKR